MRGIVLVGGLLATPAWANGQTTHLWITRHALHDHLPEGELKDLLTRPEVETALYNGAMFPDGGYAVGHPYGEAAHWEPFQGAHLAWLRDTHPPPFTDEGALHVGFLMGMASHGMADQTFDAMYMERAKVYDADRWDEVSFDEATDVVYAAEVGPFEVPAWYLPADELAALFVDGGIDVEAGTLEDGQTLLQVAVWFVGQASAQPATVADYADVYPWGSTHLTDPDVPGSPPCESAAVAAYWLDLWDRLHGDDRLDAELLAAFPADGSYGHPTDSGSIEAMVSVVLPRGLSQATITEDTVVVHDADGVPHPVDVSLFYREASHVINVRPREDWGVDADYTLTVKAGIESFDGMVLEEDVSTRFSTRPPPDPPEGAEGCGCSTAGGWGVGALLALIPAIRRRRTGRAGTRPRRWSTARASRSGGRGGCRDRSSTSRP